MALAAARRKKERIYFELTGEARLVVSAAEVGGRWSVETAQFLVALSNAKAESVSEFFRGRVAAGLVAPMEHHVGLQCSEGFCPVFLSGAGVW